MSVREVISRSDRETFIRLPWSIYNNDPHWVPPLFCQQRTLLDPSRNPFFDHADVKMFIACDANNRPTGRIAAIVNRRHLEIHNDGVGFFGMFESMDDPDTAKKLFEAAGNFLLSRGLKIMRGPANLSINDNIGLLIEGFDSPPVFMMPYNPPYYIRLFECLDFKKAMDLHAYCGDARSWSLPERVVRGLDLCQRRYGFIIRSLDLRHFDRDLAVIKAIYNAAWENNWGAVPMSDREFEHHARDLQQIVDPDLCLLAEVKGEPAGFSLALPDYNQVLVHLNGRLFPFGFIKAWWYRRKVDRIRIITTGVLQRFRHMGIDNAFYYETTRRAVAKGLYRGEMSWILETNAPMNNALLKLGMKLYKKYRVYDLPLPTVPSSES